MSRTYVAPISFGLGDLVVSLPAIQALIARGRDHGVETWLEIYAAHAHDHAAQIRRARTSAAAFPEDGGR